MTDTSVKLTALSHGGGCGCKIAPAVLADLLARLPTDVKTKQLLVGNDAKDDAAVFALNDACALVATTDFFTPIVDDPEDFGRIAAANAVSDVYAMGAKPLFALNIVGMPLNKLAPDVVAAVLEGGRRTCDQAGIVIAGGHSIDSVEPIYGLAVVGRIHPERVKTNAGAQEGDRLILSKPLGVGVVAAAVKQGVACDEAYRETLHWTTLLNLSGEKLGACTGVHAMTDVTGYGLLGHLLEICEASGVGAVLHRRRVPVIEAARALLAQGVVSPAARRNRDGCASRVDFGGEPVAGEAELFFDPQTNGGLLVACAPDAVGGVLELFYRDGCERACVIGEIGSFAGVRVRDARL